MIDRDYKIITREVPKTAHRKYFIAEFYQVYIIQYGKGIIAKYPQRKFSGQTQVAAQTKASKAFRHWIEQTHRVV
jgi:hypothetical protein